MFRPFVTLMTSTASARSVYHSQAFVLNEASPRGKDGVNSRIGVVQTSITVKLDTINPDHNRADVQGFLNKGGKGPPESKEKPRHVSILLSKLPLRP